MADAESSDLALTGELTAAPSGALGTVLLSLTGAAFVRGGARTLGRAALGYRRPATVRLSARGLQLSHRLELLGRTLGESETLVPLDNLASVTRETRYARLGLYAGLLALVLGTYVGSGLLLDGVRAPGSSPSLLGLGLVFIALGVVLDFGLSSMMGAARRTCRLVVSPRRGRAWCIQGLEPSAVDRVLSELAATLKSSSAPETGPDFAAPGANPAAPS